MQARKVKKRHKRPTRGSSVMTAAPATPSDSGIGGRLPERYSPDKGEVLVQAMLDHNLYPAEVIAYAVLCMASVHGAQAARARLMELAVTLQIPDAPPFPAGAAH